MTVISWSYIQFQTHKTQPCSHSVHLQTWKNACKFAAPVSSSSSSPPHRKNQTAMTFSGYKLRRGEHDTQKSQSLYRPRQHAINRPNNNTYYGEITRSARNLGILFGVTFRCTNDWFMGYWQLRNNKYLLGWLRARDSLSTTSILLVFKLQYIMTVNFKCIIPNV